LYNGVSASDKKIREEEIMHMGGVDILYMSTNLELQMLQEADSSMQGASLISRRETS
jgi:hypothetical protein